MFVIVTSAFGSDLREFKTLKGFKSSDFDFGQHFVFPTMDGDLDSFIRSEALILD